MAVDMFLKIEPIKGESVDKVKAGEVDVLAWSWGASNSGSAHVGGGIGSGKVNVQDLSITKYVDKASPTLLQKCCNGTHIAEAILTVRKSGGASPIEYVVIKMKTVMITSITTGGSGGEDRLTENISLNFKSFELTYTPQKPDGSKDSAIPVKWDISKNAES